MIGPISMRKWVRKLREDGRWHASVAASLRRTFTSETEARAWCEEAIREIGPIVDDGPIVVANRIAEVGHRLGADCDP